MNCGHRPYPCVPFTVAFIVFSPAFAILPTEFRAGITRLARQSGLWSQSSNKTEFSLPLVRTFYAGCDQALNFFDGGAGRPGR